MAMANGEDDASVLSQLTDKTLKEANLRPPRNGATSSASSVTSLQSGNTSKSKTQAAVKEALKEVSIEHNKAMIEQKRQFQKEIEALRLALTQHTAMSEPAANSSPVRTNDEQESGHEDNLPAPSKDGTTNGTPDSGSFNEVDGKISDATKNTSSLVQVDDSSDDEASLQPTPKTGRRRGEKPSKSPIHKRPKRSKFRSSRATGGPSSSSTNINE
jgi:hypothetical protein